MNAVAYTSSWDATKGRSLWGCRGDRRHCCCQESRLVWWKRSGNKWCASCKKQHNAAVWCRKIYRKIKNANLSEALKQAKADAQRKLRSMQDAWWSNLAAEMQAAADMKNSKELYNLTKYAFGPKTARITPLRSKDGKEVHNTIGKNLLQVERTFFGAVKQEIPSRPCSSWKDTTKAQSRFRWMTYQHWKRFRHPSISKLNLGKAAGKDGLFSEIFRFGGDRITVVMHAVISDVLEKGEVPKDWRDAIMIPPYKGKRGR